MNNIWVQLRWTLPYFLIIFMTSWMPDNKYSIKIRGKLASYFIKNCGKNFQLGRDVTLLNTYNLKIGDNVYIAKGSWMNAMGGIEIEDEVVIAPYVVISSLTHIYKDNSVRFGGSAAAPVKIGRGTWLAAHTSIKSGVSVGRGNLVAANAFVAKDTPDNVICGGVPAKLIGEVKNEEAQFHTREELMKSVNNVR